MENDKNFLNQFWELIDYIMRILRLWGIHFLVTSIAAAITAVTIFWRYFKAQCGFARNLKRTIYFLKTSDTKPLQAQKDTIEGLGIFNVEKEIKDISSETDVLDNLQQNAVYIVGYSQDYEYYRELFRKAKNEKIPIILFAKQREIPEESDVWELVNGFIYSDVANTTNRLAIILLNILKIR